MVTTSRPAPAVDKVAAAAELLQAAEADVGRAGGDTELLEQWVSHVVHFTSQYGTTNWAATNVRGSPTVYPRHGDDGRAWAPAGYSNANEVIIVQFAKPVRVAKIDVYETYNPGALVQVSGLDLSTVEDPSQPLAFSSTMKFSEIWRGPQQKGLNAARVFTPELPATDMVTNVLRLTMDFTGWPSWYEIDAIKLYGSADGRVILPAPKPASDLGRDLSVLAQSRTFSDMNFVLSDGSELPAHRAIVAARSPVLRAELENASGAAPRIAVPDLPPHIVSLLAEYVYSGAVDISSPVDALWLNYAAIRYGIAGLQTLTTPYVLAAVRKDNAFELLGLLLEADELREALLHYVKRNIGALHGRLSSLDQAVLLAVAQRLAQA